MDERPAVLTTLDCARALGVTSAFIRAEVKSGLLSARVFQRESGRRRYRITADAFAAYVERYWPERTFHMEQ